MLPLLSPLQPPCFETRASYNNAITCASNSHCVDQRRRDCCGLALLYWEVLGVDIVGHLSRTSPVIGTHSKVCRAGRALGWMPNDQVTMMQPGSNRQLRGQLRAGCAAPRCDALPGFGYRRAQALNPFARLGGALGASLASAAAAAAWRALRGSAASLRTATPTACGSCPASATSHCT